MVLVSIDNCLVLAGEWFIEATGDDDGRDRTGGESFNLEMLTRADGDVVLEVDCKDYKSGGRSTNVDVKEGDLYVICRYL